MIKTFSLAVIAALIFVACDAVSEEHRNAAEIAVGNVAGDLVVAAKATTAKAVNKAANAAMALIEEDSILNHPEASNGK